MKILPNPLKFEWDKGNIDKNFSKHGVTNKESEEAFSNKSLLITLNKKHSTKKETRYHALGKTDKDKVLFISFTIRKNKVRIISSRWASRKERKIYAKQQN